MKKILFLISFSVVCLFAFPLSGFASVYEVTVTMNQLRVPERAAMILKDPTNQVFAIYNARVAAARNSDNVEVANQTFSGTLSNGYMADGQSATVNFSYDSALTAPRYSIYVEFAVNPQSNTSYCKADCTAVAGGTGWYFTNNFYYVNGANVYTSNCPNPPCNATGTLYGIAVDPAHVVSGYWRSPAIATVN